MSNITVKFIGKEYYIPEDVLTYINLIDFTDSVQKQLVRTFARKLKNEIAKGNIGLLDDEDLAPELEQNVGKFIAKLCDNDIFNRTINDYLKNNKGYQLYSDVNKAALEKMKSLLIQKMDAWQAGYEDAINKAESNVTGMGFSIWSGSFINHAIYAAMEASTINKQEKEAQAQYQKDMNDLSSRIESQFGSEESNYINNTYIPNMEAALTVFAYELLDKYVDDLIANSKFDGKTLDYVDIGRSNDLLKNLTLSNNKQAILENAFVACPFNENVYTQALNHGFIDYDTYVTAHHFKQDKNILDTLTEKLGEVEYPNKFKINYVAAEQLAKCTGRDVKSILQEKTKYYANAVVESYKDVASLLSGKDFAVKTIYELPETAIFAGDAISKGQASAIVDNLVKQNVWIELIDKCGYTNLIEDIKKHLPEADNVFNKRDLDSFLTDKLYSSFEAVRLERIDAINIQKEQERIAKEAAERAEKERQAKKAAKKEENRQKLKKALKIILPGLLAVVVICFAVSFVINDVVKPARQYKSALALMESGNYQDAINIFASLNGYKDSAALGEQCINANLEVTYNTAVQLMDEGKLSDAIAIFETLNGYKDSADLCTECTYALAINLMDSEKYSEAIMSFESLGNYKDSFLLIANCKEKLLDNEYSKALDMIEAKDYGNAYKAFVALGDYKDCKTILGRFKLVYKKSVVTTDSKTNYYDYFYDSEGYLISEDYNNGTMITDYTYDENHNLISEIITLDSGKQVATTYAYNSVGNVIRSEYSHYNGSSTITDYYYENGILTKTFELDEDGAYETTIYFYDSNNWLIREESQRVNEYYPVGFPYESSIDYAYYDNGKLKTETWTFDRGNQSATEYIYDENGYLICEKSLSRDDYTDYIYDRNYILIEEIRYWNGEKDSSTVYSDFYVYYDSDYFEIKENTSETISDISENFEYLIYGDGIVEITKYIGNESEIIIPSNINGMNVKIGARAFYNRDDLKSVTISEGITEIGELAFAYTDNLQSITIPKTVERIGEKAFTETGAKSVVINGCTVIGTRAFYNCKNLEELIISDGTTTIEELAFAYTYGLKSITIPKTVVLIGEKAFTETAAKTVTISGPAVIGIRAFYNCKDLEELTISSGVTAIEELAFAYTYNLNSVTIPESVTLIGEKAFTESGIKEAIINGKVIGNRAFYNCKNLSTVIIGEDVTEIKESAFRYCYSLEKVTIESEDVNIGKDAFADCNKLREFTK